MGLINEDIKTAIGILGGAIIAYIIISIITGLWFMDFCATVLFLFIISPEWLFPIMFYFWDKDEKPKPPNQQTKE